MTRRFFAPPSDISPASVTLSRDETHHLRDVLRLKQGEEIGVFDGEGREYLGSIASIGKDSAQITITSETAPTAPESPLDLTLCSTVLPGEKYDLVVQKAVELGVRKLFPMTTLRCEVKPKDAERRLERWRRIAMEATKQCGRAVLMQVEQPAVFDHVLASVSDVETIIFSERDGGRFPTGLRGNKIAALLGPKGGWDDRELASARDREIVIVTLGGRVLKAETAAIAFTSLLQHRFGDLR